MPHYDYRCVDCDTLFSDVRTVKDRNDIKCHKCGGEAYISIERAMPNVIPDMKPYHDKGMDKMVYSRQDRKNKMKEMGLEEGGGGSIDKKALVQILKLELWVLRHHILCR